MLELQIKVFKEIMKNNYSVRKVEEMSSLLKNGEEIGAGGKKIAPRQTLPEGYDALKSRLSSFLSSKVQLSCSAKGKGKITIPFENEEDLERLMLLFDRLKQ